MALASAGDSSFLPLVDDDVLLEADVSVLPPCPLLCRLLLLLPEAALLIECRLRSLELAR